MKQILYSHQSSDRLLPLNFKFQQFPGVSEIDEPQKLMWTTLNECPHYWLAHINYGDRCSISIDSVWNITSCDDDAHDLLSIYR